MKAIEFFSKYQKFIIFSAIFLSIVALFDGVLAVGLMFCAFLVALSLYFIGRSKEHSRALGVLFLAVFTIHIITSLFVFYSNFQPFSGGRGDFTEYAAVAQEVSNRVNDGNFSLKGISLGHYYPVILGYLYTLTTPSVLIGELFNAWLIAILVIAIYFIVLEIGASKKEAFIIGLVASFYPSLTFFGSLLLKEALVGLLCMLALLMMLRVIKEFSWKRFFLFYVLLLGITHLRFYISYAIVLAFIISWFFLSNLKIKKRLVYGIFLIVLIGFLPNISGGQGVGQQYFGMNVVKDFLSPKAITAYRSMYAPENYIEIPKEEPSQSGDIEPPDTTVGESLGGSDSSIAIETGFENPVTFLRSTSLAFTSVVLGPFPWQLTKRQHIFILPEIIAWYILLFFIMKGIVKSIKTQYRVIIPLVLFSFITFGVLSLFLINYGITIRIRIVAVLALLCLLPFGLKRLKNINIPFLNI